MSSRAHRLTGALLLVAVTALADGCGSSGVASPVASPVALRARGVDSPVTVGVVVSLTSDPGQGSDWSRAAEGARVAAFRYHLGDLDVRLRPENDRGTAEGARDAVRRLVAQHVTGIVMATAGDHLNQALQEAQQAHVPVLLPYAAPGSDLPSGAWSTGPDAEQIGAAVSDALSADDHDRPLLVDAGGGALPGLSPVHELTFRAGDDADALAGRVARRIRAGGIDSVVVSGPAKLQGQVLAAFQGRHTGMPVVLTPQALSPAFDTSLVAAGGTLSADVTTVGVRGGDTTALQPGAAGRAAAAYYSAVRAAADDPGLEDFFDGRPFAEVAADADSRSHDAVVALVSAVAAAHGDRASDVRAALARLTVSTADGLAGPSLDFRHPTAVRSADVVSLGATNQDPGVAPGSGGQRLHWFAAPSP